MQPRYRRLKVLLVATSLIALALTFVPRLAATEFHVAPAGSDANPGSAERPFATINRGAAVAQAGDTVWILPGTYRPEEEIRPAHSGTPEAPIVFRAKGGEVIIDGQLKLPLERSRKMGLITLEHTNWIVIDGLRFINSHWSGVLVRESTGITVQNCSTHTTYGSGIIVALSSKIKVLHNTIQRACGDPRGRSIGTDECLTLASVQEFEIAYNTVSDRLEDTSNGGEGIDTKNSCRNGSVHHNTVHDLYRLGIYCDAYAKELDGVEIYANSVYNCAKGIVVACEEGGTARNVRIHDNLVYECPNGGIQLAGYLKGGPIQDVAIYQNTIVRCALGRSGWEANGLTIDSKNPANKNFVVRNNILAGNQNQIRTNGQDYLTLDRNLLQGPTLATGTNAIVADPLFVDSAGKNFHLRQGSPAIDAALGEPTSAKDHDDQPRPLASMDGGKAVSDLGAFEWSPTSAVKNAVP
jgi:hypothetical protein